MKENQKRNGSVSSEIEDEEDIITPRPKEIHPPINISVQKSALNDSADSIELNLQAEMTKPQDEMINTSSRQ